MGSRAAQLHPAAHASEGGQPVERVRLAKSIREGGGEQGVLGLESAGQGEGNVAGALGGAEFQVLAVRTRADRDQANGRAGFSDRAQVQPAGGGDVAQCSQGRRVHVGVGDCGGTGGQQFGEQAQLGGAVGGLGAVIVEMVAREVGEAGGGKPNAVQPVLVQAVGRRFHGRVLDAGFRQAGEGSGETDRVRRGEAGAGCEARRD